MSIQYQYDELNRLVAAVFDDGQEISYAYDAAGNRISITVKTEAVPPSTTPLSPKQSSQRKSCPTPPESLPSEDVKRKPPPPEKLR